MAERYESWTKPLTTQTSWCFGGSGTPNHYYTRSSSGLDGKHQINNYDMTLQEIYQGIASGSRKDSNGSCRTDYSPRFFCFSFPTPPSITDVNNKLGLPFNQALLRASEMAADHSFNLSMSLAEGKETLRFIASMVSAIWKSAKYARRGDLRRALNTLGRYRDPADSWMTYRYALFPLMSDVNSALDYFKAKNTPSLQRVRARSRTSLTPPSGSRPYMGALHYWPNRKYTSSTEVGFTLLPDVSYQEIAWLDPVGVFWEVIPGSFVIDWVLPIGDYLAASHWLRYASWKDGYVSDLVIYHTGNPLPYEKSSCTGYGACEVPNSYHKSHQKIVRCRRRKLQANFARLPTVQNPFSRNSDWRRLVDIAAIARRSW